MSRLLALLTTVTLPSPTTTWFRTARASSTWPPTPSLSPRLVSFATLLASTTPSCPTSTLSAMPPTRLVALPLRALTSSSSTVRPAPSSTHRSASSTTASTASATAPRMSTPAWLLTPRAPTRRAPAVPSSATSTPTTTAASALSPST